MKDYAKIAYGLTRYLKKDIKINLKDPQYVDSFEKLKTLLVNPPILKYPDFHKKFKISTDASNHAIGAVLIQDNHSVSFASRTLNEHEKRYATIKKELLTIVWAVNYFRPFVYGRKFELETDHQPLVWLKSKYNGKDINPRLPRWLLKLGEYDFNISYVKGKQNKVADFLSRIDVNTGEINAISDNTTHNNTNQGPSIEEDNISTNATIHSQVEEQNDHFPILDTVVNRFHTQIILTQHKSQEIKIINLKRKIFLNQEDIDGNNMADIFRRFLKNGKVGIFSELPDSEYNKVQQKFLELFPASINFYKCSYHALDLETEQETYKWIANYHKKETGHAGIVENYEGLKRAIYYKDLKKLIQKFINNCDICSRAKYDRRPIKPKFKYTCTEPSECHQIVHVDIYINKKHSFLTFIDKFSKHAVILYLDDRNHITIIEKLRLYF